MNNQTKERLYKEMTTHPYWTEYQDWLADNNHVVRELVHWAREAKASGRDKYSLRILLERARWELEIIRGEEVFKINNNAHPLLARTVLILAPDLGIDFFSLRKPKARINATPEQALSA